MIVEVAFWMFVLAVSIALLVKSSDWFTDAAERIGLHFGLSPFVVGVTIVAIGTSMPELVSSVVAVVSGASEIVIGNAVGSNIANIFLVLGFAGVFSTKLSFRHNNLMFDLIYLLFASIIATFFLWNGDISVVESIVGLSLLVVYVGVIVYNHRGVRDSRLKRVALPNSVYLFLVLSCFGIYFGAKYAVESVIILSEIFSINKDVIAASVVAVGTSLPELTVSFVAARKGNLEVAVGNVLGSNIFNLLSVICVARFFGVIAVSQQALYFMVPVMLIATIMFAFVCFDKKVKKWEGGILLAFYVYFLFKLFML